MHYEVEQKYRVENYDSVKIALKEMEAIPGVAITQVDCYYKHPLRDFARTDEAFRLRRVGEHNFMTYKGPKIDDTSKSRSEEEVRIEDGEDAHHSCSRLLEQLGFVPVATVQKQRQTFSIERGRFSIEVALDEIGSLGRFVELEIGVDSDGNDKSEVESALVVLKEIAVEFGLTPSAVERLSYLELLLEQDQN